jgi:hypothetical protein
VRAQGPGRDQAGPGRGPHARATNVQVGAMDAVQGGESGEQKHLLSHNRILCQRHSYLPTLLCLGARGPKRPMRGIMEYLWG